MLAVHASGTSTAAVAHTQYKIVIYVSFFFFFYGVFTDSTLTTHGRQKPSVAAAATADAGVGNRVRGGR